MLSVGIFLNDLVTLRFLPWIFQSWFIRDCNVIFFSVMNFFINSVFLCLLVLALTLWCWFLWCFGFQYFVSARVGDSSCAYPSRTIGPHIFGISRSENHPFFKINLTWSISLWLVLNLLEADMIFIILCYSSVRDVFHRLSIYTICIYFHYNLM